MSYSCQISFKEIPTNEVYPFLQTFKKAISERLEDIAKANASYSPMVRSCPLGEDKIEMTDELLHATEDWARNTVFKYRFFYNADLQILGMYGVDKCMQDMFDCTVYFQNSCDQDYAYEEWNGIKHFESIVDKWKNADDETVKEEFKKRINSAWDENENEVEYWKRSFVYEDIWKNFENTLFDDSSSLFLSIFGSFEILPIKQFSFLVKEKSEEIVKKYKL